MSSSKQGGDSYKPIIKEGTHLAPSKKTPGAFRGTQLSNANNQVDGQTEWVKVEEDEYDYRYSPRAYEDSCEKVELTKEQRELADMIGDVAAAAIIALLAAVAPHIKNWWQETAVPSIKRTWQDITGKKKAKSLPPKDITRATEVFATAETSQEIDEAYAKYINNITSEEAQRELLDIFILSAVVVDKIRKLSNSRIVDDGNPQEYIMGNEVVAKLSNPQFVDSKNEILKNNPNLLKVKSPALSLILGRALILDGEYVPIENKALQETLTF
jgi:hypothetical protein